MAQQKCTSPWRCWPLSLQVNGCSHDTLGSFRCAGPHKSPDPQVVPWDTSISQDSISGKPITLPVPMTLALRSIGRALFGLKPWCHDAMRHHA